MLICTTAKDPESSASDAPADVPPVTRHVAPAEQL